jgi:ribosomal protein RSM22 (predicted rRNA methylase)
MDLPGRLKAVIAECVDSVPAAALADAARRLSLAYRSERRGAEPLIADGTAALAYAAARLPATFAATRAVMAEAALRLPDFAPRRMLDFGAGPGTALWAAAQTWSSLAAADAVEPNRDVRALGERFARELPFAAHWRSGLAAAEPCDLVSACYVLNELDATARRRTLIDLWAAATGVLVIVEPGTTQGWHIILQARDLLMAAGAVIAAPCPHDGPCPVAPPEWCRFTRRVARSKLHRFLKQGDAPFEDERFIYLTASRQPANRPQNRVIAAPDIKPGKIRLSLCRAAGDIADTIVTRRDGALFKRARHTGRGDGFP